MIRIEVIGRWGEMGGVRRGDSVRLVGHPKTIHMTVGDSPK
jgi:hypothetical protein